MGGGASGSITLTPPFSQCCVYGSECQGALQQLVDAQQHFKVRGGYPSLVWNIDKSSPRVQHGGRDGGTAELLLPDHRRADGRSG